MRDGQRYAKVAKKSLHKTFISPWSVITIDLGAIGFDLGSLIRWDQQTGGSFREPDRRFALGSHGISHEGD